MIVLVCQNCMSTKIRKYEGKMAENGHDWFKCHSCNKSFPLKKADYREESDVFDD